MIDAEVLIDSKNWKKIIQNPKKVITQTVKSFPKSYRFINRKANVTILLTNNRKIKLLNKKFRKKNKPTKFGVGNL